MTAIRIITGEYGLVVSALRVTGTWRSTRAKSWAGRAMAGHSTDGAEVRGTRRPDGRAAWVDVGSIAMGRLRVFLRRPVSPVRAQSGRTLASCPRSVART